MIVILRQHAFPMSKDNTLSSKFSREKHKGTSRSLFGVKNTFVSELFVSTMA